MPDYTLWDLLAEEDELCTSTSSAVPPSSSAEACSSTSLDPSLTPPHNSSQSVHVICNVPLVAPIPLPCHYPSFLRSDPSDVKKDFCRVPKRKRGMDESNDDSTAPKRRFPNVKGHQSHRSCQRRHPAFCGELGTVG